VCPVLGVELVLALADQTEQLHLLGGARHVQAGGRWVWRGGVTSLKDTTPRDHMPWMGAEASWALASVVCCLMRLTHTPTHPVVVAEGRVAPKQDVGQHAQRPHVHRLLDATQHSQGGGGGLGEVRTSGFHRPWVLVLACVEAAAAAAPTHVTHPPTHLAVGLRQDDLRRHVADNRRTHTRTHTHMSRLSLGWAVLVKHHRAIRVSRSKPSIRLLV
jgi:hypothetical protein